MPRLGVNIDHVATLRQARGGREPDPVWAAVLAELGGAEGITIHLREDRRHIQDRDLRLLRETVQVRLNLELAVEPGVVAIALEVRPDQVTFVPERRQELTTEGGLDVLGQARASAKRSRAAATRGSRSRSSSILIPGRSRPPSSWGRQPSSCTPGRTPTPRRARNAAASWPRSRPQPSRP